jgi:hypothetical protein
MHASTTSEQMNRKKRERIRSYWIYSPASPAYTDFSRLRGGTAAYDYAGIDEDRSERSTWGSVRDQRGSGGFADSAAQHAAVRRSTWAWRNLMATIGEPVNR